MKTPCEMMIWYVLPWIRRELTISMINDYGLSQAEVARKLDLTEAAVSQYRSSKRGNLSISDEKILGEIKKSAGLVINDKSSLAAELCRICDLIKTSEILPELYIEHTGSPMPVCKTETK